MEPGARPGTGTGAETGTGAGTGTGTGTDTDTGTGAGTDTGTGTEPGTGTGTGTGTERCSGAGPAPWRAAELTAADRRHDRRLLWGELAVLLLIALALVGLMAVGGLPWPF
ncbi:hypothetical protein ACFC6L_13360 [Kitasatospora phosalacinea]|uniref:hypothetical protein n=1 Tax=Kitasatospora phosalacinea TaxID=2065 RepID=UPI0035DF9561